MSDYCLRYVPADPNYLPLPEAAAAASLLLGSMLAKTDGIEVRANEQVVFVDAGENWGGVACPRCHVDAAHWWGGAMDAAHKCQFSSLLLIAPCCGEQLSLNDLTYGWPVAFGRFFLEARNPERAAITTDEIQRLGLALGCELREIRARY